MLNINSFKLSKLNKTYIQGVNQSKQQKRTYFGMPDFKNTKLVPLTHDTVSFTGRNVTEDAETCQKIHNHAKPAQKYIVDILGKYFDGMVYQKRNEKGIKTSTGVEDAPIEIIEARIKSPDSIQEKIDKRIERAFKPGNEHFIQDVFSPHDEKGIKEHIKDISGTRIVMRNASHDNTGKILSKLSQAILENGLLVDEIQNYVQVDDKGNAINSYFEKKDLDDLLIAINLVREQNELGPIVINEEPKASGYMALHLDFNLENEGVTVPCHGFHSEMQIIGSDVAKLKDIEDFCYKLKAGDKIKSGRTAYIPFETYFNEAFFDKSRSEDEQSMFNTAFNMYTKQAYVTQRSKATKSSADDGTYRFPTIEECGLKGLIPPILDFNNLARIKKCCDELDWVHSNPEVSMEYSSD